jgi:hypothetical protein
MIMVSNHLLKLIQEYFQKMLGKQQLMDSLRLVIPLLALALILLLPLPGEPYQVIVVYFVILLITLLGLGLFKKWYSHGWYFFWVTTSILYLTWYIPIRFTDRLFDGNFINNAFTYIQYSWKCEGPCYVPMSPISSVGIILLLGLLVLITKRVILRFCPQILFTAFSFWVFYLIIMPPVYKIMNEFNVGIPFYQSELKAYSTIPVSLILMALFLATVSGRSLRKLIFPFFALFSFLFLLVNASTLQYMKHHVGYSIRWVERFSGNRENLLALFRNFVDILWIRPALYFSVLLMGILIFFFFLQIGKRIGRWQKKITNSQWIGVWVGSFLFLLKIASWTLATTCLAYMGWGFFVGRINFNQFDEAIFGAIFLIGKDKENLLFFIIFLAMVVIVSFICFLLGHNSRQHVPRVNLFSFTWLRNRALEIICALSIIFVIIFTCTGFKVTAADWRMFRPAKSRDIGLLKNGEAKFWLKPIISLAVSHGLNPKRLNEIQKIVEEHESEINKAWHRHFSQH